jgi:hypothetical protein
MDAVETVEGSTEAQAYLRQADQSVPCKSIAEDLPIDDVGYSAILFAIRCWSDDWGAVGLVLHDLNNNLELLP